MSNISVRINLLTETLFIIEWGVGEVRTYNEQKGQMVKNYEELYQVLKLKDKSGKWLTHYHNLLHYEDGKYLDNMLLSIRRRYNKRFDKYFPQFQTFLKNPDIY